MLLSDRLRHNRLGSEFVSGVSRQSLRDTLEAAMVMVTASP